VETLQIGEYLAEQHRQMPAGVARALHERYSRYLAVSPSFGPPGFYDLRASDWVGQIVVDDFTIKIEPKTPVPNLFHMLTYAYNLDVFRKEEADRLESSELFECIVLMFLRRVEDLVRKGIGHGYVVLEENEHFLRGRLQVKEQLCRNAVTQHRFCTRHDEFTADISDNRLLKAVLFMLSRLPFVRPDLRPRLRRLLHAFDEVALWPIRDADFERVPYSRLNEHYRPMHKLARLLWRHCSLDDRVGNHPSASYLLHMYDVFERFVATYLEERFSGTRIGVLSQCEIPLDSGGHVKGVPDLVLQVDGQHAMVLDTKYKLPGTRPSNDDFYQVITYCHTLGLDNGMLVYPGRQEPQEFGFKDIRVRTLPLDLEGAVDQFKQRCAEFAEQLEEMVIPMLAPMRQPTQQFGT